MCRVITTIWWREALTCGSCCMVINMHGSSSCVAINVHGNYYYMVEGSPHVWLTRRIINVQGSSAHTHESRVAINMHSSSHVAINMQSNH